MGRYFERHRENEVISVQLKNRYKRSKVNKEVSLNKMNRSPYLSDQTIVPRVKKYLESNVDKTFVDINVMADDLQRSYREYGRLKRSSFRASVKKAYSIVLQSYGVRDRASSEYDLSDFSEPDNVPFHSDSLSSQIVNLYSRPLSVPKPIEDNELIDLSSSGDSEGTILNTEKSNGPSTSHTQSETSPVRTITSTGRPFFNANSNTNNTSKKYMDRKTEMSSFSESNKKRKHDLMYPSTQSVSKKKKSIAVLQESTVTFKDVGGIDKILEEICKLLMHIRHPEIFKQIGITPPRGFLLHGPPGCGKTLLANAIAGELGIPLLKVAAPELVAGVSGKSEEKIRDLFEKALYSAPCILFIDEIDVITPHRQNVQKDMERRIVAQLLGCLDDLNESSNGDSLIVIGATNRPNAIDPALRRAGRFDREISLGIPDEKARLQILKVLSSKLKLSDNFNYEKLAKLTPGFVGADLMALIREASMVAVNKILGCLKEQRKLANAMAYQKIVSEISKSTPHKDLTRIEPEILVDDDILNTKINPDSPIVVIDDDLPKLLDDNNQQQPQQQQLLQQQQQQQVQQQQPQPQPQPSELESKSMKNGLNLPETALPIPKPTSTPIPISTPPTTTVTVTTTTTIAEKPMLTIDLFNKTTPLEDLLIWLHDNTKFSTEQLSTLCVTTDDFIEALKLVQPSAKREGFITVPDVTWDDIGSLRNIREELQMSIITPVKYADKFLELGITTPTGVLLCGPPGCGKTLLAKAIANEAGINFISIKGPELLNMYVGESERAVRVCFERARNSAPCVIFFDELDAICPKRSDDSTSGAASRVVNQLLTEMDGVQDRKNVFILSASNRPDIIDPAVLRPGRLDKILFVDLPTPCDRVDILRAITKNGTKPLLSPDVDLEMIGKSNKCNGYTGADLAALVHESSIIALKEFMLLGDLTKQIVVNNEHFNQAFQKIRPSVSEKDQKHYNKLKKLYSANYENEVEEMEFI